MSDVHAAQDDNAAPQNNESEVEARNLGWVPKEEFRGDPAKWRPAEEFLDRGKRILPIVLKDNERLQRNLNRVKDELKELRDSTKQLVEFHSAAEERAYERARRELEQKAESAAANADPAGVKAAMTELSQLAKPATVKTQTTQEVLDPDIQDWIAQEQWFNRNQALRGFAIETYGELEKSKPGLTTAERLAETKRLTVEKFPERFGVNPNRETASAVATPSGSAGSRKRGKTYDDLPPEAKAACDKFVKQIPGYTRDKYVANYAWES